MVLKVFVIKDDCQYLDFLIADYLVVGSDSGRISILEYNAQRNAFEKVLMILSIVFSEHDPLI